MNKSFLEKLAGVRVKDLLSLILCLAAWPLSFVYRRLRPHLWLLCEYGPEARDNGYWLYRYLRQEHPEVDAVYAINRDSVDRNRVTELGPVVDYGSFAHWILYLSAEVNISSQKGGKPNAAVCYLLEVVTGILKNRRVFLQHGIIKDDLPFLHKEKTNLSMFVTSTQREFDFVDGTFGYEPGVVVLTGLARYDNLVNTSDGKVIALMPTWREWLYVKGGMERVEGTSDFRKTAFFRMWAGLIRRLLQQAEEQDLKVVLCLHRNLQQYNRYFEVNFPSLTVVNLENGDVADVLKSAACLITDYSSVAIDFAYLRKPLAYFQADYEQFRKNHLPEGYFDYRKDGFGQVFENGKDLLDWIRERREDGFTMEERYRERTDQFFTFHDQKYCERNYQAICNILKTS